MKSSQPKLEGLKKAKDYLVDLNFFQLDKDHSEWEKLEFDAKKLALTKEEREAYKEALAQSSKDSGPESREIQTARQKVTAILRWLWGEDWQEPENDQMEKVRIELARKARSDMAITWKGLVQNAMNRKANAKGISASRVVPIERITPPTYRPPNPPVPKKSEPQSPFSSRSSRGGKRGRW